MSKNVKSTKKEEKEVKKEVKQEVEKENKKKKEKKKIDSEKMVAFFQKVDDNRWPIILFVVGFLIATLLFRCILWPDRIATLKDGTQPIVTLKNGKITADDLYEKMKSYYSIDTLLSNIDDKILSKKFPSNDEMEKAVQNTADYYYYMYENNYGYTREQFLSNYGFKSEADFIESLRLDYRRNEYYEDYVLKLITDDEVKKYYEDEVYGDVDTKHILVSIGDNRTDEEASKMAKEIISKLDNGTSWEDVIKEYGDDIVHEELGYNAFNAELEEPYLKESKNLAVGTYSKTPVLTSYGYHVVYKIDQKEKPKLEDIEDEVKEAIAKVKKNADKNLYYKSLIKMREDAKLEFKDTVFGEEYEKYVSTYK